MLRIECPWCGLRDEPEFGYGGEAELVRPAAGAADAEWAAYLYDRTNPKGGVAERWWHRDGCGQWFTVRRDTVTHAIEPAGAAGGRGTLPRGGDGGR